MKNLFDIQETKDLPFKIREKKYKPDPFGDRIVSLLKESRKKYHLEYVSLEQIRAALYRKYKIQKTYQQIAIKMEALHLKGKANRVDRGLYTVKEGE